MKRILPLIAIVMSLFLLIGCGAKEVIEDTPAPVVETTPIVEKTPVVTETPEVAKTPAAEETVIEELPEEVAQPLEKDVWVKYMIQPNDYLTKIAMKEYGVVTMWRSIWDWNLDVIGNNPDLIYPYEELSLKKDASEVKEPETCGYEAYTVKKDDTLWSIAKDVYGNSYAWIVLMRDNLEQLGSDYNSITPGMILKVRTSL